jgi:transcriptional regulator with XRE-family HTH domain
MTISDEQIGRNLAKFREERGKSQKDLADAMKSAGWKWSQATVWAVEKGDRPLRLAEAEDVASILEMPSIYLTYADKASTAELSASRMHAAYKALKEAFDRYEDAQMLLAITADEAADDLTGRQVEGFRDWITQSPIAVYYEWVRDTDAERTAEHRKFTTGLTAEEAAEQDARMASYSKNGQLLDLLNAEWDTLREAMESHYRNEQAER